ncbi:MFS transporter [Nocardia sp. NPDC051052]|uniref:MFS transporter n=1 Tax=Nocardia sp. NPDC051052 TaxID=3364322 RepID=UPI003789B0F0
MTVSIDHREKSAASAEQPDSGKHNIGFWVVTVAFCAAVAFSMVPTPLYPLYAEQLGLSSLTLTIIFAVYGAGVIFSLCAVGHVSDWIGRRRVLTIAISVEVLAAVVFLLPPQLPLLIAGRLITGLGVGAITATATAYLHELHVLARPRDGVRRFEIASPAANIGGLGVGALVAGVLTQWAPWPLRTSFVVFAVFLVLVIAALVWFVPETVSVPRSLRPAYRPQRVSVIGSRLGWVVAAGSIFAAFAAFGLFASLAPVFLAGTLGQSSRFLAGAVVFLVFGSAPVAQHAAMALPVLPRLVAGLIGTIIGSGVLVAAVLQGNLVLFLAAGVLSGAGAGVLIQSAVARTVRAAAPAKRGEAAAGLFLIGNAGLIIPVIGMGVATQFVDTRIAMAGFAGALIALLVCVAVGTRGMRDAAAR